MNKSQTLRGKAQRISERSQESAKAQRTGRKSQQGAIPNVDARAVQKNVLGFFSREQRALPWRKTRDPYAIWVSEIMCQQTRVATAVPYYERWMARFPTVATLAKATLDDVLPYWAGLGYYRRAKLLHQGASEVMAKYGGALPASSVDLLSLPGIGRYTAGAIASIAFGEPAAVVDGNVARVLSRLFAVEEPISSSQGQKHLWRIAEALVPEKSPGDFNQGLMELGATVCTPEKPACLSCPLREHCYAFASGRQKELPVVPARPRIQDLPVLSSHVAWVVKKERVLLVKRTSGGLYSDLWELPQASRAGDLGKVLGTPIEFLSTKPLAKHTQILSHRRLQLTLWPATCSGRICPDNTCYAAHAWQPLDRWQERGLSNAMKRLVEKAVR